MPRIRVNQSARIAETFRQAPNVTRGAGMEGQAVAGLGRAMANVSEDVGDMFIKARDNTEMAEARAGYEQFRNDLERDLKQKFANDPTGYAQEVKRRADEWLAQTKGQMSTPQGAQGVESWGLAANARLAGQAQRVERTRLAGIHQQSLTNFGEDVAKARAEVPRVGEYKNDYAASLSTHEASVGTAFNTFDEALKAHKNTIKKIAFGNLEGLTRMESSNHSLNLQKLRTAKAVLKDDEFTAGMSSKDKAIWLDRVNKLEKHQKNKRDSISMDQLNDYFIAKTEGKEVSSGFENNLLSNLQQIQDKGVREKAVNTFAAGKILGQALDGLDIDSYDDVQNFEEDLEKRLASIDKEGIPFNEAVKRQVMNKGKAEAQKRLNLMESQGADYVAQYDDEVKEAKMRAELSDSPEDWQAYFASSKAAQQARKIPNIKLFTEQDKGKYVTALKSAVVSGQYKQVENELKLKFGSNYPQAISELSSADKQVKSVLLATRYGNASSKAKVFSNMKAEEDINTAFKALGLSKDKLDKKIEEEMQSFIVSNMEGTNGAERLNFSNSVIEQVKQEAMLNMTKGMDPGLAVKEARASILEPNYMTLGHHGIVVPKTIVAKDGQGTSPVNQEIMDRFFDEPFRSEVFEGIVFSKENIVGRDEYMKHIENKGKWILAEDQNHFQLMVDEDGVYHQVRQENQQPVRVHIDDIQGNSRYIRKTKDFATHIYDFLRGVDVEASTTDIILEQRGIK